MIVKTKDGLKHVFQFDGFDINFTPEGVILPEKIARFIVTHNSNALVLESEPVVEFVPEAVEAVAEPVKEEVPEEPIKEEPIPTGTPAVAHRGRPRKVV
jgi:hypothetical protein